MRVLVTGAKGMLGQEFMRQLGSRRSLAGVPFDVMGWGREDIDITNEQEVMQKILALKLQIIINCAAYNNVDKAEDEPEIANAINGEAPGYLARAAAQCGATFVHFSTDYVFSGNRTVGKNSAAAKNLTAGYNEEDMPDPISVYGQSKALGEQRMMVDSRGRANLPRWYIVRTSKLFGPPGTGATSKKSFPEMMIKVAKENGRIEAIDGEVGSPTYVKDLAEAILNFFPPLRVRGGEEGLRPSGIYHLTNSGSCTWYEYAKAAVEFAGVQAEVVPVPPDRFPRKAKRSAHVVLLNTKLPPLRSWQEALKEFLSFNS